ncbi:tRNA-splicing endonuclease subunit [Tulasnella sp. JGI-2019a]|nr:tRNA-splicing endonuclease subunit [Tulasnella sp. JGI-2019a]KAG9004857.1 tRNA-splicing endonuclease subunit [Tulasnella sp. JGI-2019a]
MSRKIPLHVFNQNAFVWNTDDAATLRKSYHITGMLTGTLPTMAQQNVFLGIPLLLMPEEVVFLVEKEVAILLDDAHGHNSPTPQEREQWEQLVKQRRLMSIQGLESIRKEKENTRGQKSTPEAELKRKEREAKRAQKLAAAKAAAEAEESVDSSLPREDSSLAALLAPDGAGLHTPQPSPNPAPAGSKEAQTAHTIIIPGSSDDHPWFRPPAYETLEAAKEAGVWTYPSNIAERAKCAVFRDLIEKGYFIGGGIKFGGDWLVYPGDQLRYHSHFVATVYPTPTSKLDPMEIVAHGRLGTGTKKAHLLCGWDEERKVVDYYSIEWANFG